jgi:hypothetical protein
MGGGTKLGYGTLCSGGPLLTRTFTVSADAALPGRGLGLQTLEERRMRLDNASVPSDLARRHFY